MQNLVYMLEKSADQYPDKPSFIHNEKILTYKDFDQLTNQWARLLQEHGIMKGRTCAVYLPNEIDYVLAKFAVLKTGATVVLINPLNRESEIEYILVHSEATAIITNEQSYQDVLKNIAGKMPRLKFFTTDIHESTETLSITRQSHSLSDQSLQVSIDDMDTACMIYTSGTTGKPKGVMLSHESLYLKAYSTNLTVGLKDTDCFYLVLPAPHIFGEVLVNCSIYTGATTVIRARFKVDEVLEEISKHKCTIFSGVPNMFIQMVNQEWKSHWSFQDLRIAISGAASLPVSILKKFEERFNTQIIEGYGLTENGFSVFNHWNKECRAGSIGFPVIFQEGRVVDESGQDVPANQVGELILRSKTIMKGYFKDEKATQEAIHHGWLYTGDLARMDKDGYIYIVDRKKEMINMSGYKVYPREVEEVLYQHPHILEVAVVGVDHALKGEAVKAIVVTKEGKKMDEQEIIQYCKDRLSIYKVPTFVEFVSEIPKTGSGKIQKRALAK